MTTLSSFDPSLLQGFVFEPLAKWSAQTPDKLALVGREVQITYAELESGTNALANALQARGIGRGARVSFVLPRGPKAVVLLISILKAGAAYVPLDADSPQSRIKDCLEDAQAQLVIVDEDRFTLEEGAGVILPLRTLLAEAEVASKLPLNTAEQLQGTDLAYIIFTSGTTGRPKGVPIAHEQLSNFIAGNQRACICVQPDDIVFQGFSPASDGHHEEVWPTLAAGATLVVATSQEIYSGADLSVFLNAHKVTVISCAPTLLSMLEDDIPSLRRILFGAENLPAALVKRWAKPGREILNTYGPTEATVGATFSVCQPDQTITIGKPLPNYYCDILSEDLTPVPVGEEGELCLSGVGVSRGYFAREELSVGKFVPNPFADSALHNPLLYRTGDRVKKDALGNIVWLGRVDAQVKIRGHRIELSEIENHVLAYPAIASGVVITRASEDNEVQLVALLVVREGVELNVAGFLESLRDSLPAYMLPQVLEHVKAIPRLPSGKVDRRACESLHGQAFRLEREIIPPQTDSETLVVALWKELFPGQEISSTDDFFRDLGGYSLLASKFISKLRGEKGFAGVSVLDIYENPTVRSFAAVLEMQLRQTQAPPAFKPIPSQRHLVATLWQALGLIVIFGIQGLFWLGPIVSAIYFSVDHETHFVVAVALGLVLHALSVPLLLTLVLVLKWVVGGKFKPGSYPLWGSTFLRWWFVQKIQAIAPVTFLTGTPLASAYLRLLGAKVGRNVMLESLEIDCPDLIEIGDDCSFENSSWIHPSEVAHGELHLRAVKVGKGCSIGVRSGLSGGSEMGQGASLRDLTCVTVGTSVPEGEEWAGGMARKVSPRLQPEYDPAQQPPKSRLALFGTVQTLLVVVLTLLDSLPFVLTAFLLYSNNEGWMDYLADEPLYAVGLVLFAALQVLLVKWLALGRLKPGTYAYPGFYALRKWFTDKHLEVVSGLIVPIYDSLFARPWCIALGMKCGPRCEIALPRNMPYDLVEMGEESFLASEVSIGRPIRCNGKLTLERTVIGKRAFLGNDSVVPQGVNVPDEFLLGVLSACPHNEQISDGSVQAWLGSPAFKMPSRQVMDQFDTQHTYSPTAKLYVQRIAHEVLRVVLPSLCSLLVASVLVESFIFLWNEWGLLRAFALVPVLYVLGALTGAGVCRLSKAVFIGTYHPTIQPLWSQFVWKTETHSAVLHDFAVPLFLSSLTGTPFLAWFLKLMGARVGKRVFINTTDWTETDLIHLGEDVAINANAPLQAHLFEDRVMKVGLITVGDRCTVGNYSVILCESELKSDAHVGHLSLVMKGETIPSHTFWSGSPAQSVKEIV